MRLARKRSHAVVLSQSILLMATYVVHARSRSSFLTTFQVIGDQATQRAIDLDQKHGVSNKFLQTLSDLDKKLKVFAFPSHNESEP
jgi:hypothetical protein